jgi:hypothetical protein
VLPLDNDTATADYSPTAQEEPTDMQKKVVRIELPLKKSDELIALGKKILAKHDADADASPLDKARMEQLRSVIEAANDANVKLKELELQLFSLREQRDTYLGITKDQGMETVGTVLNGICYAGKELLDKNPGNESSLCQYGFKIVFDHSKPKS